MIVFKRTADLASWLAKQRAEARKIGFVPTMGALHEGHISLIKISKKPVPDVGSGASSSNVTHPGAAGDARPQPSVPTVAAGTVPPSSSNVGPLAGMVPPSLTVCSIFVNPTQFNDPTDFQKYPITLEKDMLLLEKAGTDVLFLPAVEEMYPKGTKELESYDIGPLESLLEGKYRPGHFQGVCQVMYR